MGIVAEGRIEDHAFEDAEAECDVGDFFGFGFRLGLWWLCFGGVLSEGEEHFESGFELALEVFFVAQAEGERGTGFGEFLEGVGQRG